ncbi:MAG: AEC family transporter [Clostridiaceae bacterium]|nr:AEC family transporter [Clostridiaceae bacterium]
MGDIFLYTLSQTLLLFFFLLAGAFLRWRKLLPDNTPLVLSRLEMTIILPALNFKVFAANFNRSVLRQSGITMLAGVAVLGVVFSIALVLSRFFAKDRNTRDIYTYSFTIPNYGYMGYALMAALYGESMLFSMIVFALPLSMFTYSVGMYLLSPQKKWDLRTFLNPSFAGILLGVLVGLSGVTVPPLLMSVAETASNCMAPLAMLLTGFVIAGKAILSGSTTGGKGDAFALLRDRKVYLACAIRLLALPLFALGVCLALKLPDDLTTVIILFLAMPMGLNTIVFPEAAGGDSSTGAKMALISNVAGLVTIPFVLSLL